MCEIILLFVLGKKIAAMAAEKGRAGWPWVIMLILFWIGGEITGAIIGTLLTEGPRGGEAGDDNMLVVLGCAVGMAVLGAVAAFTIVSILPAVEKADDDYDRPRRRSRRDRDEDDDRPRRRDEDDDAGRDRKNRDDDDTDDRPRRRRDHD